MSIELLPFGLVQSSAVRKTVVDRRVYANGTNGNDAWDGTSPTFVGFRKGPKKTIQAAVDLLPEYIDNHCIISIRGIFTGDTAKVVKHVAADTFFGVEGGLALLEDQSSVFTATGSSALTLTVAGETWDDDEWAGQMVRMITSPASGVEPDILNEHRLIMRNTADTITIGWNWTVDPQVGTTFAIARPASQIAGGSLTVECSGPGTVMLFHFLLDDSTFVARDCEALLSLSHVFSNKESIGAFGLTNVPDCVIYDNAIDVATLSDYGAENSAAGISVTGDGSGTSAPGPGFFALNSIHTGPAYGCYIKSTAQTQSAFFPRGSRVKSWHQAGSGGYYVYHGNISNQDDYSPSNIGKMLIEGGAGVGIGDGVLIGPSDGHGITVEDNSRLVLGEVGANGTIAGAGVYAHQGAIVTAGGDRGGSSVGGSFTGPVSPGPPVPAIFMILTLPVAAFGYNDSGTITIAGATSPANNGTFPIAKVLSSKQIIYVNPAGVGLPPEAGAGTWALNSSVPTVTGTIGDCSTDGVTEAETWANICAVFGGTAVPGTDTISAPVAGVQTMTLAAAPFTGREQGKYILVQGSATAANNGRFLVTSAGGGAGTQISYINYNFSAVADGAFAGTWGVDPGVVDANEHVTIKRWLRETVPL